MNHILVWNISLNFLENTKKNKSLDKLARNPVNRHISRHTPVLKSYEPALRTEVFSQEFDIETLQQANRDPPKLNLGIGGILTFNR